MEDWNNRFSEYGKIRDTEPSKTAIHVLSLFKKYDIKNILIPGAGYGRHTKFFSTNIIEENENHGDLGAHSHKLRYIFVKKE